MSRSMRQEVPRELVRRGFEPDHCAYRWAAQEGERPRDCDVCDAPAEWMYLRMGKPVSWRCGAHTRKAGEHP